MTSKNVKDAQNILSIIDPIRAGYEGYAANGEVAFRYAPGHTVDQRVAETRLAAERVILDAAEAER